LCGRREAVVREIGFTGRGEADVGFQEIGAAGERLEERFPAVRGCAETARVSGH
jgi:hypothetical protein